MEVDLSLSMYESIHIFLSYCYHVYPMTHVIFSLIILLIIVSILVLIPIKRSRFQCKCEICHSYVTSSWSKKFTNICDWYTFLLQNSPSKTIHIHVLDNIITANPKNVEYMLKTNFKNYPKGKAFSTILGDLLGHGIFNVDGDAWRFQRKMASLELERYSVRSYSFQVVKDEIDNQLKPYLYAKLLEGQIVDLQEIFRAFSLNTISKFSFGVKIGPFQKLIGPLKDFSTSFDLATKLSAERALEVCSIAWRIKRLLCIGKEKKLRKAINEVDNVAMEIIKQRCKKLSSSLNQDRDLLSRFMNCGNDIKDRYLRDIIVSFLLAGRDTVASALTSFFWLIAQHPQVESSILLEADRVLGKGQSISMYDQIGELHYLQASIFECMRLYPPIQFDSKFALDSDMFPDTTKVIKGTRVTYHPYAMGRMEMIWGKDCYEFKPERWLKNGVFVQENPYKYPVFQAGVRVCLGKEMALIQIKCVIIGLLREFHFDLAYTSLQVPKFSPGLTATFSGGVPVILCARNKHVIK